MSVPHRHKVPTHSRPLPLSASQSLITRKCYQRKVTMSHTMGFLYCCNPLGRGEREKGDSWHVCFQKALLHTDSSLYRACASASASLFTMVYEVVKCYYIKLKSENVPGCKLSLDERSILSKYKILLKAIKKNFE